MMSCILPACRCCRGLQIRNVIAGVSLLLFQQRHQPWIAPTSGTKNGQDRQGHGNDRRHTRQTENRGMQPATVFSLTQKSINHIPAYFGKMPAEVRAMHPIHSWNTYGLSPFYSRHNRCRDGYPYRCRTVLNDITDL